MVASLRTKYPSTGNSFSSFMVLISLQPRPWRGFLREISLREKCVSPSWVMKWNVIFKPFNFPKSAFLVFDWTTFYQKRLTTSHGHLIEVQTHAGHSIAFNKFFCTLWPFDLILIVGWGLVMDYPCDKFSDCSFSCFGFIVRTDTHRIIQTALNASLL